METHDRDDLYGREAAGISVQPAVLTTEIVLTSARRLPKVPGVLLRRSYFFSEDGDTPVRTSLRTAPDRCTLQQHRDRVMRGRVRSKLIKKTQSSRRGSLSAYLVDVIEIEV
ncbi:hypothetical protein AVEN_217736-1 [Araneus ventricosus]|uniref:Uncharacterized protein n=1 Tax=Araneus ventricosus TaxID=182803 RepID=A0A4Y2FW39_ARAVE|nr:hypothetical protein AVEN_217736-1 [Araneus ventricosus]